MASVFLFLDRPDIAEALTARGMAIARSASAADVVVRGDLGTSTGVPCLVLAADDAAQVGWLDAGADDVAALDADARLIAARIAALLQRTTPMLTVGDVVIDTVARRVTRGGRRIALLPREYALLLHLAHRPDATVSRVALRAAVWGLDFDPGTNVIEVHVSRLRAKLHRGFATPVIVTDRGIGYRLVCAPAPIAASAAAS